MSQIKDDMSTMKILLDVSHGGKDPAAVKTLVEHGIIGTLSAWEDVNEIKPSSARAIVIKFADYINQRA